MCILHIYWTEQVDASKHGTTRWHWVADPRSQDFDGDGTTRKTLQYLLRPIYIWNIYM